MKSSINCILIGLATFDSILIVTSILMFGFPAVYAYTQSVFDYYFFHLFPYMTPFMYPIGMIAQTGSAYLTLCVTLERYVAVCLPLQARSLCTYTRACWYVFGITLFAGVYNLPRFWEVSWYSYFDPEVNQTRTDIIPTALRDNQVYISVYITWMYLVVMYIIPFCSLAVFNLIIYHEVRRANSERARLTRLQQKANKQIAVAHSSFNANSFVFIFFLIRRELHTYCLVLWDAGHGDNSFLSWTTLSHGSPRSIG